MKHAGACRILILMLLFARGLPAQQWTIRPLVGGFPADSGFAAGVELVQPRLAGPFDLRVKAIGSVKRYQYLQLLLDAPQIGPPWLSVTAGGQYRNYPEEDFWGLGPNTARHQRENYLFEDVDLFVRAGLRSGPVRALATAGYVRANSGPGRDSRFASVPESLQAQPRFPYAGFAASYDSRDDESDSKSGGRYGVDWTAFGTILQRVDVDLRQFIPIQEKGRIGLRLLTTLTRASQDDETPFFMLPYVGGANTVRGLHQYRFRDRNSVFANVEYRREIMSFIDAVAFIDAGQVASTARKLASNGLHTTGGFGARLKFGTRVFFGVDVGIGPEGRFLWFRSAQMF